MRTDQNPRRIKKSYILDMIFLLYFYLNPNFGAEESHEYHGGKEFEASQL